MPKCREIYQTLQCDIQPYASFLLAADKATISNFIKIQNLSQYTMWYFVACYSEHLFSQVGRPGSNKKAIFIDGGIHAREWISPATVIWIVDSVSCNITRLVIKSTASRTGMPFSTLSFQIYCCMSVCFSQRAMSVTDRRESHQRATLWHALWRGPVPAYSQCDGGDHVTWWDSQATRKRFLIIVTMPKIPTVLASGSLIDVRITSNNS